MLDFGPYLKPFFELLHTQLIAATRKRIQIQAGRTIGRLLSLHIEKRYPLFFQAVEDKPLNIKRKRR